MVEFPSSRLQECSRVKSTLIAFTLLLAAAGPGQSGNHKPFETTLSPTSNTTGASILRPFLAERLIANADHTGTRPLILVNPSATSLANSKTFYVSTSGEDSDAGTSTAPWKTIQHAADCVHAGDTVFVHGGIYPESVNIPVSGSAEDGAIVFRSYPGETAIVDGTHLTPSASHVQGLFNLVNRSYVTIQGFEIRNYSTANANATPAGIWVTGSGSHIEILNNMVHNIASRSETRGNAFGIAVYGSSGATSIDRVVIGRNQVYALRTGNSESVTVNGNVTNFSITENTIHDNDNVGIDVIGFESVAPSIAVDYARNGEISGNTVYNISAIGNPGEGYQYSAAGIYVDGGANIVIERNRVHNCDLNIEAASEHAGRASSHVIIRSNLVYHANSAGISIGGYASSVGGSDYIAIVNNTMFEDDTKKSHSGELQVYYHAANSLFKNNIVYATPHSLFINNFTKGILAGLSADYNLYFHAGSAGSAEFLWNGVDRTGMTSYQDATGQDAHSAFLNPEFKNNTTPDLEVEPLSSPALNRGKNLGPSLEGTVDFTGNPRVAGWNIDVGAYQHH